MLATIKFKLPEEQEDFELALNGSKYKRALDELDEYLRSQVKYAELTEESHNLHVEIRAKLWEIKKDIFNE